MTVPKTMNANFPMDEQGHVHHVGVRAGQVSNLILTVGDPARLNRIASLLDAEPKPFENTSSRGFTVVTGRYQGVEVSLVAIGMGIAMVDFFVREIRAVVSGDITIIRFGSCGSLDPTLRVGSIGVPERAVQISTNYAHWHAKKGEEVPGYLVSPPITADAELQAHLFSTLSTSVSSPTCEVRSLPLHASADTFYSSQGRLDPNFQDDNTNLLDSLLARYPDCASLEMETAHLFHLSSISHPPPTSSTPTAPRIKSAACHMVFADRTGGEFIEREVVEGLEGVVGRGCLEALVRWGRGERGRG
ncbi:RHTO0S27e00782g1_1 [Rhodotorula toruloides]|uniref:RHTO0S27e00782g1_1 n=1 Tax=Rhodotorula toruloides TaxID=5286 RepID=A0A061BR16_RHOTO|nr:RHTO0S27e00782g1_1 [Rhodotorula toruloides]